MTTDALRQLQDLARTDDQVLAAVRAATTPDEVVLIAQQHGIDLDVSELAAVTEVQDTELSDAELEEAAGGWHSKTGTFSDDCL